MWCVQTAPPPTTGVSKVVCCRTWWPGQGSDVLKEGGSTCQDVLCGKNLSLNFKGAKKITKLWWLVSIRIPTGI